MPKLNKGPVIKMSAWTTNFAISARYRWTCPISSWSEVAEDSSCASYNHPGLWAVSSKSAPTRTLTSSSAGPDARVVLPLKRKREVPGTGRIRCKESIAFFTTDGTICRVQFISAHQHMRTKARFVHPRADNQLRSDSNIKCNSPLMVDRLS